MMSALKKSCIEWSIVSLFHHWHASYDQVQEIQEQIKVNWPENSDYLFRCNQSDDDKKHNIANTYISSVYYQGGIGFAKVREPAATWCTFISFFHGQYIISLSGEGACETSFYFLIMKLRQLTFVYQQTLKPIMFRIINKAELLWMQVGLSKLCQTMGRHGKGG